MEEREKRERRERGQIVEWRAREKKRQVKATVLKKDEESQRKERQRKWDVTQVFIVHK
jgi:hypothetical protein